MAPRPPIIESKRQRDFSLSAIEAGLEERYLKTPKREWKKILEEPHEQVKGPGRVSKLTEKVAQEVWAGIRMGMTTDRAAQAAGVHRMTLYRWFKAGKGSETEPPREPYASFFAACVMADAQCERDCLHIIRGAANGETKNDKGGTRQWTAAAWILERRYGYSARPKESDADPNDPMTAPQGASLADVTGASEAMAANMSDSPPVDPKEQVRELEAMVAQMRAEIETLRKAANADLSEPEMPTESDDPA